MFTTILPSAFVLLGFLIFGWVAPGRNLDPITLDIQVYNDGVTSSVTNPIAVNSPDNPYICQLGTCSHKRPLVQEELTNETYFFCGFQAKIGISMTGYVPSNSTCSISESTEIMSTIAEGGASPNAVMVGNISEVSVCTFVACSVYAEKPVLISL
jgi:hypothetical protein